MWVGNEQVLDPTQQFEKGRIRTLQEERIRVQEKTFTKWINFHLKPTRMQVNDLFMDIRNGKMLHQLLQVISGETLPKVSRGAMRIQQLENVGICLSFLSKKVTLENIGAGDIVDGNKRLILGLIWTIILRFQIQQMVFEQQPEEESAVKRSAKESLLLWCQRQVEPYKNVQVTNFDKSWQDGMAFNALLHSRRPDLVNFDAIVPSEVENNLRHAFDVNESELHIPKLLDAEDVMLRPDDKSIMTYIAQIYSAYAKMKLEERSGRRMDNVMRMLMNIDDMEKKYLHLFSDLVIWVRKKTRELNDRTFPNSLAGVQQHLDRFNRYRTEEKPIKYNEKGELHMLFHSINVKCFANNRIPFYPPEGHLIKNIEAEWDVLDKAERDRERAIVKEYLRLESLERVAERFVRKEKLRLAWLEDMWDIVEDQEKCRESLSALAAYQRNEAILLDVQAREEKFNKAKELARFLWNNDYNNKEDINKREKKMRSEYESLRNAVHSAHVILMGANDAGIVARQTVLIRQEIKALEPALFSEEFGSHFLMVEDLLRRHSMLEGQIVSLDARIHQMQSKVNNVLAAQHPDKEKTVKSYNSLRSDFKYVKERAASRRKRLEDNLDLFQFHQDADDEEMWLNEQIQLMSTPVMARDLLSVIELQKKQKAFEQKIDTHSTFIKEIVTRGQQLMQNANYSGVEDRVKVLPLKLEQLRFLSAERLERLQEALETQQYYTDANDVESWMKEKFPLVSGDNFGKDSLTATNLFDAHKKLNEEIENFMDDVVRLREDADRLKKTELALQPLSGGVDSGVVDEFIEEEVYLPVEIEDKEMIAREIDHTDTETREIPRVITLRDYKDSKTGRFIKAGTQFDLQDKSDELFWVVKNSKNGLELTLPRSLLRDNGTRHEEIHVSKVHTVHEEVSVKRIQKRKQMVKRRKTLKGGITTMFLQENAADSKKSSRFDAENIQLRQQTIESTYKQLKDLSAVRLNLLKDFMEVFNFISEAEDMLMWIDSKDRWIRTELSQKRDSPDALRQVLETFLTELVANEGRVKRIRAEGEKVSRASVSNQYKRRITDLLSKLTTRWEELKKLKNEKEKILAGAAGLNAFQADLEGAVELAKYQILQLENALGDRKRDSTGLLKHRLTPEDLQAKMNKLNKTVKPLDDRINKLIILGNSLAATNPSQAAAINKQVAELKNLRKHLQELWADRVAQLEEEKRLCQFKKDSESQIGWAEKWRHIMSARDQPADLDIVTEAVNEHSNLKDEIDVRLPVIEELIKEAEILAPLATGDRDFAALQQQIQQLPQKLTREWRQRDKFLNFCKTAAQFYRDSNLVEAQFGAQLALLSSENLGVSVDEVESLQRALDSQKEKVNLLVEKTTHLNDRAFKITKDGNVAADEVNAKMNDVNALKDEVISLVEERENNLKDSLAYQTLLRDVAEMDEWMLERLDIAHDPEFKEMVNIDKKQKIISTLESELETRYSDLNQIAETGKQLIANNHYASAEIKKALLALAKRWKDLKKSVEDAAGTIGLAHQQKMLRDEIKNRKNRLADLEDTITAENLGSNLNEASDLLRENDEVEEEIIKEANDAGGKLARAADGIIKRGHHDPKSIQDMLSQYSDSVMALRQKAGDKKAKLKDSGEFFQWREDALSQKEWFLERVDDVSSTHFGSHLDATANLLSRHQALDQELSDRESSVEELLLRAQNMIVREHWAKDQIESLGDELTKLWNSINTASAKRLAGLESQLHYHRILISLEDALEYVDEKLTQCKSRKDQISSHPDKLDERKIANCLSTHKTDEVAISRYCSSLNDLDETCNQFVNSGSPMSDTIKVKQTKLGDMLDHLTHEIDLCGRYFETCKLAVEFQVESTELCDGIVEAAHKAQSPDYGRDYESFEKVAADFQKLKDLVASYKSNQLKNCENLCSKIGKQYNGDDFDWVPDKLDDLSSMMNDLEALINEREELMESAGELHKFNHDVVEALGLVQEKHIALPNASSNTLQGVQKLLRNHENFETSIVPLEAQLLDLVEEADRLSEVYPGENEESLAHSKSLLITSWQNLKGDTSKRRQSILLNLEFQKYKSSVRDLNDWLDEQSRVLSTIEESVVNAESVKDANILINDVRMALRNREDDFRTLVDRSDRMITGEDAYPNTEEIDQLLSNVLNNKSNLEQTINNLESLTSERSQFFTFYSKYANLKQLMTNEIKVIDSRNSGQVSHHNPRGSIREQEALENKINKEQLLLEDIETLAHELQLSAHPKCKEVNNYVYELQNLRQQVLAKSKSRRALLDATVAFIDFNVRTAEEESWLNEKQILADNTDYKKADTFELKIKVLQKHQALESEIDNGKDRFSALKQDAQAVIYPGPFAKEAKMAISKLEMGWRKLMDSLSKKNSVLIEAREVVKFFNQCDSGEQWLKDKENLLKMRDLGDDYEQCMSIINKLNKPSPDEITAQKLNELNKLADSLMKKGQLDPEAVESRQREINDRYKRVVNDLKSYWKDLEKALEVHKFIRDCNEINDCISERIAVARSDEVGDSLDYAHKLINRHELVEKTTIPELKKNIDQVTAESRVLSERQPVKRDEITRALESVSSNWLLLNQVSSHRQKCLQNAIDFHRFFHNCTLRKKWADEIISLMQNRVSAKSVKEANNNLTAHENLQEEIKSSDRDVMLLAQSASQLKAKNAEKAGDIELAVDELKSGMNEVKAVWDEVHKSRLEDISMQQFLKEAADCDLVLSNKENLFNSADIGDSLLSVDALLSKYQADVTAYNDICSKTSECIAKGNDLIRDGHRSSSKISERIRELQARMKSCENASRGRKKRLEVSKDCQMFLQKTRQMLLWIADQDKKALDECYKDPTNLLHKIEIHSHFERDLKTHEKQIEELIAKGKALSKDHFHDHGDISVFEENLNSEIENKTKELNEEWLLLMAHSGDKKEKLREALQAVEFDRACEKVENFAEDCEKEFESDDYGDSLKSVKKLMKKHEKTKDSLAQKSEIVASLLDTMDSFKHSENPNVSSMELRLNTIVERYDFLDRAAKQREDNLKSSFLVYTFIDKVNGHTKWGEQKLVETELNYDWTRNDASANVVESLLLSSQNLDKEVKSKEETMHTLDIECNNLLGRHPAHKKVLNESCQTYQQVFKRLAQSSLNKTEMLKLVLSALRLLTRINQSKNWLSDKRRFLMSIAETQQGLVRDEDSCERMLNQVVLLESELKSNKSSFSQTREDLDKIDSNGQLPQREILTTKVNEVEELFEEVEKLCSKRVSNLTTQLKQFEFLIEVDEVLQELETVKDSTRCDDYGDDVESVELIISDFIGREKEFNSLDSRCNSLIELGSNLTSPGSSASVSELPRKITLLKASCQELKTLRDARMAALDGARLVHKLDRDVEDCKVALQDKQVELSTSEHDVDEFESVQMLYDKQNDVEKEVVALETRVDQLNSAGAELALKFNNDQHVNSKLEELNVEWKKLTAMSGMQNEKLKRLENVKQFYDMFREIIQWINETIATMNSDDLPRDVPGATLKLKKHTQLKATIKSKQNDVKQVLDKGQALVESGVSVQEDILEKRCRVQDGYQVVENTWSQRNDLYIINLDLQEFIADVENMDSWMQQKMPQVTSKNCGNSLIEVEDLLKKQVELEELIEVQREKLLALNRKTKLESGLADWKEREEERLRDEQRRKRQASLRKKETTRITDERSKRNREQRRRTQEIVFTPETVSVVSNAPNNNDVNSTSPKMQLSPKMPSSPQKKSALNPFFTDFESQSSFNQNTAPSTGAGNDEFPPPPSAIAVPKAPIVKRGSLLNRTQAGVLNENSNALLGSPNRKIIAPNSQLTDNETKVSTTPGKDFQNTFSVHRKMNIESAGGGSMPAAMDPTEVSQTGQQKSQEASIERAPSISSVNTYSSINSTWSMSRGLDNVHATATSTPKWSGLVERKPVLQAGGRKPAIRHWKPFFTVVISNFVKFYKDERAFVTGETCSALLPLDNSICEEATDYRKRSNTIRLILKDGAEYLLDCKTATGVDDLLHALREEANNASLSPSRNPVFNYPPSQHGPGFHPPATGAARPSSYLPENHSSAGVNDGYPKSHSSIRRLESGGEAGHGDLPSPTVQKRFPTNNIASVNNNGRLLTNGSIATQIVRSNTGSFNSKGKPAPPLPPKHYKQNLINNKSSGNVHSSSPSFAPNSQNHPVRVTTYSTHRQTPAIITAGNRLASITYGSSHNIQNITAKEDAPISKSFSSSNISAFNEQSIRHNERGSRVDSVPLWPPSSAEATSSIYLNNFDQDNDSNIYSSIYHSDNSPTLSPNRKSNNNFSEFRSKASFMSSNASNYSPVFSSNRSNQVIGTNTRSVSTKTHLSTPLSINVDHQSVLSSSSKPSPMSYQSKSHSYQAYASSNNNLLYPSASSTTSLDATMQQSKRRLESSTNSLRGADGSGYNDKRATDGASAGNSSLQHRPSFETQV